MKQKLPQPQAETIALFPKNIRLITEYTFTETQTRNIKIALVSAVSIFLLALITMQVIVILDNLKQQDLLQTQRQQLESQVKYWEGIASQYQGYRDVYYRIAMLQYKLGNVEESQKYVKKALELDPNFPEGRVLGAHVGLE